MMGIEVPGTLGSAKIPQMSQSTVIRVIKLLAIHLRVFLLASSFAFGSALLGLAPPVIIKLMIDQAIPQGDRQLLVLLTGLILGVALLGTAISLLQNYFFILLSERLVRLLRLSLFEALQRQSLRFFVSTKSGEMMSRLWNDVSGVQMAVGISLVDLIGGIIVMASTLTLMLIWDWALALLAVSLLPFVLLLSYVAGRLNRRLVSSLFGRMGEVTAFTVERLNVQGFLLVTSLGSKQFDLNRFADGTLDLLRLSVRQSMASRSTVVLLIAFPIATSGLLYLYGGLRIIGGELSLGTLVAFVVLSTRLSMPISSVASLNANVMGSLALFERIFEWIDQIPEITDSSNAKCLASVEGVVTFRNVFFEYREGVPVLKDLSFQLEPGRLVALVGPSGAGKTTVTYLILRFYDPRSGCVEIDGHNLRNVKLSSLRQQTSIVTQETVLFNSTIRENLLISKPSATQEEIVSACKAVQLHEFVETLPNGYDTVVGDHGYSLSGGERQRLAIARAILKQPKLLIMDEPTSSVDSITERSIRAALTVVFKQCTTMVIAHRLSTILAADKILVLDNGELIDSGRHNELLDRCGLYRQLYDDQFAPQAAKSADVEQSPLL